MTLLLTFFRFEQWADLRVLILRAFLLTSLPPNAMHDQTDSGMPGFAGGERNRRGPDPQALCPRVPDVGVLCVDCAARSWASGGRRLPRGGGLAKAVGGGKSPTAHCPPPPPPRYRGLVPTPCVTFRLVVAPLRGPGRSPVLPFACCIGLLLSVGRCGRCSCWCRFRVRGAQ